MQPAEMAASAGRRKGGRRWQSGCLAARRSLHRVDLDADTIAGPDSEWCYGGKRWGLCGGLAAATDADQTRDVCTGRDSRELGRVKGVERANGRGVGVFLVATVAG
jgi:hypothetical protein